jgi:hypothetical protein
MEREFYVYKHTNKVNGKVYIGVTCQKPKQRWKNGKGYIDNEDFWADIEKYDWNQGFDHEILYSGLSEIQAEAMEILLIDYYDSRNKNKGYNILKGGRLPSEKTRRNISKSLKGKFRGYNNPTSKTVICLNTGYCFGSSYDASRYYNIDASRIRKCCKGKNKSAGKLNGEKLRWCYVSDLPKPQLTEADKVHLRYILNKYSA